jgi:hypothetical protein
MTCANLAGSSVVSARGSCAYPPHTHLMVTSESAVIVPVPETEPAVGQFRAQLNHTAAWECPRM